LEDLYAKYSKDFRKVVDNVFGEEYPELSDQLRANVSRFAAYKSNYVKTAFEENSKAFSGDDLKAVNEATKNQFRYWTETELATASARARTAKQFSEFNEADRKELFPCLKWLPSRAANPRQSHMRFYNRVWRKDDPFWNNNAPGTEWNCACDVEECEDQPTDNSNVKQPIVPQGLEGNPSVTGEVFTDKASYIAKASEETHKSVKVSQRDYIRRQTETLDKNVDTSIGKIKIDDISIIEASKGSVNNDGLFRKIEIAQNIEHYTNQLDFLRDEEIDLGHNNRSGKFYRRKTQFEKFEVYKLNVNEFDFTIKFGVYKSDGSKHLYSITG